MNLEEKRIFLIATPQTERAELYSYVIQKHIQNSTVFICKDGTDALFKVDNYPPHVVITDMFLPKKSGIEITEQILRNERYGRTAIIIASDLPDTHHFVDEVVTGRVQFLIENHKETALNMSLAKALNFLSQGDTNQYKMRFLTPEEILFKEGEEALSVFIVKNGELEAFKGQGPETTVLGGIHIGEFVGEMAHINGEPRSATVRAVTDCELIEIPRGTLDMVLFSKPAWSKALIATLSKRLKRTNEALR